MTPPVDLHLDRLVQLSKVDSEGHLIKPEFWARIHGEPVFVTAVLERTVVFVIDEERKLTGHQNCWVDPDQLIMYPVTTTWGSRAKGAPKRKRAIVTETETETIDLDIVDDDEDDDDDVDLEETLPNAVGWIG